MRDDAAPGDAPVQSILRAFQLLEALAAAGGTASVTELRDAAGLPLATIHRLLRTLVAAGYVRQESNRAYALSARLTRLGEASGWSTARWATPHLQRVVDQLDESANLAKLDGVRVVYVAQVPGRHSMRMFTEVGRHAGAHSTAVGKAMLAQLPPRRLQALAEHLPSAAASLAAELELVRRDGYAIDDEEQEAGVRCVAVALPPSDAVPMAVSISGPVTRMTDDLIRSAVPVLTAAATALRTDRFSD
ncbi:IclR family transcriptional regulator [Dactylosporangium sucinum]|uniref:Glycerol operon regulatory protein n=1 Tax=Dactylosporangium sucinum TaxID=1424081 RepID=A0A917WQI4_9ACTN|nr:IclR family transcriptional regulator [Dactylosporangium sucinum]GGM20796.1 IclR family transcriptional regulator [Dactylosporangium sucinum]